MPYYIRSCGGWFQSLSFVFFFSLVSSASQAETQAIAMMGNDFYAPGAGPEIPVILTTSRLKQPQSDVAASVTVLDRQYIESLGVREIPELFRYVPGMSVGDIDGNVPTVSYHATVSRDVKRMQVLVDGRSVYQPGLARVLWDNIPLTVDDIEKIEITRGPNAAAYGPNSFSAIINIITRHPDDTQGARVRYHYGNNGIEDYYARWGNKHDDFSYRLAAYGSKDDGYNFDKNGDDRNDEKKLDGFNFKSFYQINPDNSAEFHLGYKDGEQGRDKIEAWENLASYNSPPDLHSDNTFTMLKWKNEISDKHTLQVQFYAQESTHHDDWDTCMYSQALGGETNLIFTSELFNLKNAYDPLVKKEDHAINQAAFFAVGAESIAENVVTAALSLDPNPDEGLVLAQMQSIAESPAGVDRPLLAEELQTLVRARDIALANNGDIPILCGNVNTELVENRIDIEVVDNLVILDNLRLMTGASYRKERAESRYYINGRASNAAYNLFSHVEYRPFDFMLVNIGAHYENDTNGNSEFSPRVASNFSITENHSIRLVYSQASRTTDIYEDYASIRLTLEDINQPYASNPDLLGMSIPTLFVRRDLNGRELRSETIISREIGYYGFIADQLEIDIRYFEEELDSLYSEALTIGNFDINNKSEVFFEGVETQIKWNYNSKDFLLLVYTYLDSEPSTKTESRFTAKDTLGIVWSYFIGEKLNVNLAYFHADKYNVESRDLPGGYEIKRLDWKVSRLVEFKDFRLRLSGKLMYRLDDLSLVSADNNYDSKDIYFLGIEMEY